MNWTPMGLLPDMDNAALQSVLERIASALERMSPQAASSADLTAHLAYHWDGRSIVDVEPFSPTPLDLLTSIDKQKALLLENSARHANGFAAHDALLWGSRGMGKSALVKAITAELASAASQSMALVEASAEHLDSLPTLFGLLAQSDRRFVVFIDDIGFEEGSQAPRLLRSMLEGGAAARPSNVRLYVTSNRRHIIARSLDEQNDPINPRDVVDDKLALSDRFGLRIGFHAASQDDYLAMVKRYATEHDLPFDQDDALLWATQHGSRSGRVAWQYIVELAGRVGQSSD